MWGRVRSEGCCIYPEILFVLQLLGLRTCRWVGCQIFFTISWTGRLGEVLSSDLDSCLSNGLGPVVAFCDKLSLEISIVQVIGC